MSKPVSDQSILLGGFYTVPEVMNLLGLGRSTVYKLLDKGDLPNVRFGACRKVPKEMLSEYVRRSVSGGK